MSNKKIIRTRRCPSFIKDEIATALYNRLKNTINWHAGIKNTRKAYQITHLKELAREVRDLIVDCIEKMADREVGIAGIYYNYYRDGDDYTPNHRHEKTIQLIISLGATRTLVVGKKTIKMGNGDVAVFGSSIHGVPKEPDIKEGRISIAVFLVEV